MKNSDAMVAQAIVPGIPLLVNITVWRYSLFTDQVIYSFKKGDLHNAYDFFGSRKALVSERTGYYFAVWAPQATAVSVISEFNQWQGNTHRLFLRPDNSGIWEGFIPGFKSGTSYKYRINGYKGVVLDKGDPYAHYWQKRPQTASIAWDIQHSWTDECWMANRKNNNALDAAWSVYEVHLASWIRPDNGDGYLLSSYAEITDRLVPYVAEMGFTHVELMPIMEYPFDGSWGYQGTGYFALLQDLVRRKA